MRLARVQLPSGQVCPVLVEGQELLEIAGDPLGCWEPSGRRHDLVGVRWLPPVVPSKIVALGTNFRRHALEMGRPVPAEPKIFLKAPSALIGHGEPIVLPVGVPGAVEHEAEVAVVIGRRAHGLALEDALSAVLGFCCINDVTARALQARDGVFARAKGFDTFAPLGPWIETDVPWPELVVEGWVNGQRRQRGELSDLIFGLPEVLVFVSRVMTLLPGDLIALGTPSGVGPLLPGDEVEVRIGGVGNLRNPVVAEVEPRGTTGEGGSL